MSDHDEALLDEDFGDEEYDLGNDEEEALLADDNDFERLPQQLTISKGEEETDDVLDLGVTDALDDLEAEEENIQSKNSLAKTSQSDKNASKKYENISVQKSEQTVLHDSQKHHAAEEPVLINRQKDLREKLREKSNSQRESLLGKSQNIEDDDHEEAKEKRNRFPTERVVVNTKMNHNIPDSLENVVTPEEHKSYFRTRDRGDRNDNTEKSERCDRNDRMDKSDRGERSDWRNFRGKTTARYDAYQSNRYHHGRGHALQSNQQPAFRGPLMDNRISFPPGPSNNSLLPQQHPHHHHHHHHHPPHHHPMYSHHNSPQVQPLYHQPVTTGPVPGHAHFVNAPMTSMPPNNTFPEPMIPPPSLGSQGPRINVPRIDFGPRGPPVGPAGHQAAGPPSILVHPAGPSGPPVHPPGPSGPAPPPPPGVAAANATASSGPVHSYNCSLGQPSFSQSQQMFVNHGVHASDRGGAGGGGGGGAAGAAGATGGGPSQGSSLARGMPNPTGVHGPVNPVPISPSNQQGVGSQSFARPPASSLASHQNLPTNSPNQQQPVFESRLAFSEAAQFDGRPPFDSRSSYNNPVNSQFNAVSQLSRPPAPNSAQQILISNAPAVANISNVPVIPTGHKILINPHFRGNQAKSDAAQDAADQFVQALRNASNPTHDNRLNSQQIKNDDPYSYFSDVWQENKSQRSQNTHSRRSYSPEGSYSKSGHNNYDSKYKTENQWTHREGYSDKQEHRSSRDVHRDKESPPRIRSDQRHRVSSPVSNSYRNESDHGPTKSNSQKFENSKSLNSSTKESNRTTTKRITSDNLDRSLHDISPKKAKTNIRRTSSAEKLAEKQISKEDDEELDPEMREYRRKMEEQKRLREKILREKENRRKLAAMQKQNTSVGEDNLSKTENLKPELMMPAATKENVKKKINLVASKTRGKLRNVISLEDKPFNVRVVRTVANKQPKIENKKEDDKDEDCEEIVDYDDIDNTNDDDDDDDVDDDVDDDDDDDDDGGKRKLLSRIILNKAKGSKKSSQKSGIQSAQRASIIQAAKANRQLGQIRQLLTNSQRIVVPSVSTVQKPQSLNQDMSQHRQRIVVHKSAVQEPKKLIKSNIVQIDNLAASTTESQIRRMCHGIGSIESVKMGEGNATIVFKTQSAAMVFHKKYQRKMLDLSLIKVQLVAQSSLAKQPAIFAKNLSQKE